MWMLSVGEDARKGVAFGLEYGCGGGMEENEVEEGEACSSQEYETTIDPDIALSYIVGTTSPSPVLCSSHFLWLFIFFFLQNFA